MAVFEPPIRPVTAEELIEITERGGPLLRGRYLICPGCEHPHDILAYKPFKITEKYADQTVPPLKCPSCRFIFALHP